MEIESYGYGIWDDIGCFCVSLNIGYLEWGCREVFVILILNCIIEFSNGFRCYVNWVNG